ncbi:MBL fold metallo-hydrolase [Candidatus Halobonum tyrrellensis]|uniref:MBL fold metallo-hydrolase n=1 Tax=Candidatus Halobonum tyrrellensis TaxID=1431545 RepID=UPI00373AF428
MFFVGTATVVVRYAGFTILTDPNFLHAGDHAHLGYGLSAERRTDPALDLDELPDVDFVLLSHYHGDHFDHRVQEELDDDLPIVTTHHAAEELDAKGFTETYPLDTWETFTVRKGDATLDVTATPGRHGPPVVAEALPEVMGSVLEFYPDGDGGRAVGGGGREASLRIYVSGDTLLYDEVEEVPERYPDIDLALLHLGGTEVVGVLLTMDADQGVDAVRLFDADVSIPIHYDDYDVFRSPLSAFRDAVSAAGLDDRVAYLDRGEAYALGSPAERR